MLPYDLPSGDSDNPEEDVYYLSNRKIAIYTTTAILPLQTPRAGCKLTDLRGDIPAEVPWCSEALGKYPDAVNLWIVDSRSVTSIHIGWQPLRVSLNETDRSV
jgi:jumonji domain-containing protein 7